MRNLQNKIKQQNIWKWLFFFLVVLNAGVIFYVILLFQSSPDDRLLPAAPDPKEADLEFTIVSDKDNLNELINRYLRELTADQDMDYTVYLENNVRLAGSIRAFNQEIPALIVLDPVVQDNGDLILQQESISLGQLQLPNRRVLDYVQSNYRMPEWIEVDPENEIIHVAVTEISKNENIRIEAQQFDLENDQISFSIHTPYESLPFNKSRIMNYFK
ncbi:YpmS family protein [Alteribacillus iranensis]|uniref:Uncharacterized protein YpmS n=1 Tax=Alteribacillus iranensis TaxID=930128 RepID=A0A1I2BNT9_9BACI|nr:YpmS family protein [Alteribacillus iranensis]SFE57667.1 Uncharacterized protein YpmS [Alteribacillus iranensis]